MLGLLVCCHGFRWRSLVCLLDNVLHAIHLRVKPVCDWHDRLIMQKFPDDEDMAEFDTPAEEVQAVLNDGSPVTFVYSPPGGMRPYIITDQAPLTSGTGGPISITWDRTLGGTWQ